MAWQRFSNTRAYYRPPQADNRIHWIFDSGYKDRDRRGLCRSLPGYWITRVQGLAIQPKSKQINISQTPISGCVQAHTPDNSGCFQS